jgi:phosphoribosylformylglycinamidine synthase subunit PurQ / glutaminase
MRAAVIVFPGSNREKDVGNAFEQASGKAAHYVWHTDTVLPQNTDVVVLPGGFSYGDYLRCGAIAARAPIMDAVRAHAAKGGKVLAICNGFQIACEAGLLSGVLMRNSALKFISKLQHLRVERNDTAFTQNYAPQQIIKVCIAHGEGNYCTDPETLSRLDGEGLVAFRYCDGEGKITLAANPNGSQNNIAGVYNASRTVLGMMPHPENLIESLVGGTDGKALFQSLCA